MCKCVLLEERERWGGGSGLEAASESVSAGMLVCVCVCVFAVNAAAVAYGRSGDVSVSLGGWVGVDEWERDVWACVCVCVALVASDGCARFVCVLAEGGGGVVCCACVADAAAVAVRCGSWSGLSLALAVWPLSRIRAAICLGTYIHA